MRKLNPPKNFRRTLPRCCLTCKHRVWYEGDGSSATICERDQLGREDSPELSVCDYYAVEELLSDQQQGIEEDHY